MLVRPDGTCAGTIGGGAVEYQARQEALSLWEAGVSESVREYDLSHAAAELGMVCGGRVKVEFKLRKA